MTWLFSSCPGNTAGLAEAVSTVNRYRNSLARIGLLQTKNNAVYDQVEQDTLETIIYGNSVGMRQKRSQRTHMHPGLNTLQSATIIENAGSSCTPDLIKAVRNGVMCGI